MAIQEQHVTYRNRVRQRMIHELHKIIDYLDRMLNIKSDLKYKRGTMIEAATNNLDARDINAAIIEYRTIQSYYRQITQIKSRLFIDMYEMSEYSDSYRQKTYDKIWDIICTGIKRGYTQRGELVKVFKEFLKEYPKDIDTTVQNLLFDNVRKVHNLTEICNDNILSETQSMMIRIDVNKCQIGYGHADGKKYLIYPIN